MSELQDRYTPSEQQDSFTEQLLAEDGGFVLAKKLEDGTYVGVTRLMFTLALCIGITPTTMYVKRFCFNDAAACMEEYANIKTKDDEPEGWIARRPEPVGFYDLPTEKPIHKAGIKKAPRDIEPGS